MKFEDKRNLEASQRWKRRFGTASIADDFKAGADWAKQEFELLLDSIASKIVLGNAEDISIEVLRLIKDFRGTNNDEVPSSKGGA